jgi:hypothetical protein
MRKELGSRLRGSLATIVQAEEGFPLVVLIDRKGSGIHSQGTTQLGHKGRGFGLFKFLAMDLFVQPCLVRPLEKVGQLARGICGFVLAAKTKTLDLSLIRLAQLVDLLAGFGVCSANRGGYALQAVQIYEV